MPQLPYLSTTFLSTNMFLFFQVLINVGLCITLYDILHMGDPYIIPGDRTLSAASAPER